MSEQIKDIALTEGKSGQVVVHRADCKEVRRMAASGVPVATLFGVERLPTDLPWHSCMEEK